MGNSISPPSRGVEGGHGGVAPVLDPYKNNSNGLEVNPLTEGHYRRQFEGAAMAGAWGHKWGTCGRRSLLKVEGSQTTLAPALCGCWACELCGVRRAAWLKAQLWQAVQVKRLGWFWTLPIKTDTCGPVESFTLVTASWDRLRSVLQKHYGRFSFVWTVEATKQGYAHLHVMASLHVSAHELHGRWHEASGGSYMVQASAVTGKRAANYLAKYCVQQATLRRQPGHEALQGKRLFSKSRDIEFDCFKCGELHPPDPDKPKGGKVVACASEGEWRVVEAPYWDMAAKLRNSSYVLSERVKGVPSLTVRTALEVVS